MSRENGNFTVYDYVTAEELVKNYGTEFSQLPTNEQQRYTNYAKNANRTISSFLYRWVDQLPLPDGSAALEYSKGMAFKYAQRLKQVDDGSANEESFNNLYHDDKKAIEETLKAQPQQVNTRSLVSNNYNNDIPPYSQTGPGAIDFL